jgi:hypothetical protein
MEMLEQKLRRLAEVSAVQQEQWDEIRKEWITEVNRLFDEVEGWLHKWTGKGYLAVRRSSITLSEEHLGDYEIPQLELIAGPERIVLEPLGRHILGALGRIDLYLAGFKSDARMVLWLEDVEGSRRWEVWRDKYGGPRLPFNQETLERIMNEWL